MYTYLTGLKLLSTFSNEGHDRYANSSQMMPENIEKDWPDLESRKRILLAAFIIDTQRKVLFHQPLTQSFPPSTIPELPAICPVSLWNAPSPEDWRAQLPQQTANSSSTPFEAMLTLCKNHHANLPPPSPPFSSLFHPFFNLSAHIPLHSLLLVASSSWLFARKSTLPAWNSAKTHLRAWSISPSASISAWWAGRLLRTHFQPTHSYDTSTVIGLEVDWTLYVSALVVWAYFFPTAVEVGSRGSDYSSSSSTTPVPSSSTVQQQLVAPSPSPVALTMQHHLPLRPSASSPSTTAPLLPSSHTPPNAITLHSFLLDLNTVTPGDLVGMKIVGNNSPGVELVLSAVADIVREKSRVKGALLAEAVGVLDRLRIEWRRGPGGGQRGGVGF